MSPINNIAINLTTISSKICISLRHYAHPAHVFLYTNNLNSMKIAIKTRDPIKNYHKFKIHVNFILCILSIIFNQIHLKVTFVTN